MRIGVDATCWHNRRGYGRHARALLRALVRLDTANQYTLFLDCADTAEPTPEGCEVRVLRAAVPTVLAAASDGRRSLRDMWRAARSLSAREFDLLLFPTIYSYVPTFGRARKLVVLHDVIADTYPALTVPSFRARHLWNAKVALGRMQADALITVSEYSRDCIVRHFGIDRRRIAVVGEAADPVFRRLEAPVPGPKLRAAGIDGTHRIAVYLGGFSPHKNLEALVTAFGRVAEKTEFADVLLVMAGAVSGDAFHSCLNSITALIDHLDLRERVIFPGYLDDEDLVVLLNLACVLALPSLMEGFGLPAVEAAACGCPVIATKASPLPELLSGAGIFIEPREDDIAEALERVLSSEGLRAQMRQCGLAAARRLTWEDAARQMIEVIRMQSSK